MRRQSTIVALVCSLLLVGAGAQDETLPDEYRTWLEEEVVYIITEREKEVFLSLESRDERVAFIQAFWRKRDPNPATPQNEFQEEHQSRFDYANRYLGRDSPSPGWKSDRGRMYIKLGKPQDIQRFPASRGLVPTELWFYSGDPSLGLPAHFYLIFFKQRGYGAYRLYHPAIDGPEALLVSSALLPDDDPLTAVENLQQLSPELARASLSLDMGEPADFMGGRPAPGTDFLLANIESSSTRGVKVDYADAGLRHLGRVSSEYTFNYVPHRSFFAVLAAPDGTPFVNFAIELDPEHFSLEADDEETTFYTTLDITVELRNEHGALVLYRDKAVYLELTPSQLEQVVALPFSYQDSFPVLAGDYSMSVIVKNRVLRQFTLAEHTLHVEAFSNDTPALTDVILGFSAEPVAESQVSPEPKTFQIGKLRIRPASDGIFSLGESAYAFLQVAGASPDHELQFSLSDGERTLQQRSTKVRSSFGEPVVERFVLEDMAGGRYQLGVCLVDSSGKVVAEKSTKLNVTPRSAVARPAYVMALSFNSGVPGMVKQALGEQLLTLERYDDARQVLEEAVSQNGQLPVARWLVAAVYNRAGEPDRALGILEPIAKSHGDQYEVMFAQGYAYYLKNESATAIEYLERAMSIRPAGVTLLNALADCYQNVGELEKAREALERSLKLAPDQNTIKEQLQSLGTSTQREHP